MVTVASGLFLLIIPQQCGVLTTQGAKLIIALHTSQTLAFAEFQYFSLNHSPFLHQFFSVEETNICTPIQPHWITFI